MSVRQREYACRVRSTWLRRDVDEGSAGAQRQGQRRWWMRKERLRRHEVLPDKVVHDRRRRLLSGQRLQQVRAEFEVNQRWTIKVHQRYTSYINMSIKRIRNMTKTRTPSPMKNHVLTILMNLQSALKMQDLKMQDMKSTDQITRHDFAGYATDRPNCRTWNCRKWKCRRRRKIEIVRHRHFSM